MFVLYLSAAQCPYFSLAGFAAILALFKFLDWYFEVAGIQNGEWGCWGRVQFVGVLIWILEVSNT